MPLLINGRLCLFKKLLPVIIPIFFLLFNFPIPIDSPPFLRSCLSYYSFHSSLTCIFFSFYIYFHPLPAPISQTFHTPSLGDEEFEIPPISLDPDSALNASDVVSHFGELSDAGPSDSMVVPGNAVVEGDDPSFASTFVNATSQGLEHLSLGVINQSGGSALLGSSLGMVRSPEPLNSPKLPPSFTKFFRSCCLFVLRISAIQSALSSAARRR